MNIRDIRKELARGFDDNLHTRQWHNYVDYAIIFLILLSTAEIFISTFPISPTAEKWMKGIDWFTQIFFTIEVSLRIWTANQGVIGVDEVLIVACCAIDDGENGKAVPVRKIKYHETIPFICAFFRIGPTFRPEPAGPMAGL